MNVREELNVGDHMKSHMKIYHIRAIPRIFNIPHNIKPLQTKPGQSLKLKSSPKNKNFTNEIKNQKQNQMILWMMTMNTMINQRNTIIQEATTQ